MNSIAVVRMKSSGDSFKCNPSGNVSAKEPIQSLEQVCLSRGTAYQNVILCLLPGLRTQLELCITTFKDAIQSYRKDPKLAETLFSMFLLSFALFFYEILLAYTIGGYDIRWSLFNLSYFFCYCCFIRRSELVRLFTKLVVCSIIPASQISICISFHVDL